jgi:hypothetical protein
MSYGRNAHGSQSPGGEQFPSQETRSVNAGKPAKPDTSIEYLIELETLLNNLPRNFGAMRQEEAAEGGDPLPFTTRTEGSKTTVYLPSAIDRLRDVSKKSLAIVVGICQEAGFNIASSKRVIDIDDFNNTLEATEKSLIGAFYCLRRDEITPTTNIPSQYATGWEYAQWYAFAKATSDLDHGEYLNIPRVTSFLAIQGSAWSSGRQFTTLQRLAVLVRLAAQNLASRVKNIMLYLKPEGFFKMRFVGKRPIGGLYLQEEYDLLTQEWEGRNKQVETLYKGVPLTLKVPLLQGNLKQYMAKFNIGLKPMSKKVEETARSRITNLLVQSGTGRNKRTVISKGGNLPEKLRADGLNLSVRTIGKVMWSPLMVGMSQNQFTDLAISLARRRLHGKLAILQAEEEKILDQCVALTKDDAVANVAYGTLSTAASVYLEIYPDYNGNTSWDTALGGFQRE